ncbi:hypothetical protein D779_3385 [Imhoffiella purpurea]|uniref:Probable oxaloacetate decarboxylase gamma chain n=2 Tax=Imhoffiella purpurea TaxID=1249627 RepID=W9VAS1_9GAMM|nr:hypothetical protein D779_3385 [Imhoffiella purpurea]
MMESLRLMMIGMGIVFGFLLLLVGILKLVSSVAQRIVPAEAHPVPSPSPLPHPPASDSDDLIAVIGAAVARYRRGHR